MYKYIAYLSCGKGLFVANSDYFIYGLSKYFYSILIIIYIKKQTVVKTSAKI